MRRRWPPERSIAFRSASPASWKRASTSSARRRASAFGTPWKRAYVSRLSRTERNISAADSWTTTEMRRRTSRPCRTTSKPRTVARPDVGAMSVFRIFSVVVLPAPFGPRKPEDRAARNLERETVDGAQRRRVPATVDLHEVVDVQRELGHGQPATMPRVVKGQPPRRRCIGRARRL
jgi:hypothetical protein